MTPLHAVMRGSNYIKRCLSPNSDKLIPNGGIREDFDVNSY